MLESYQSEEGCHSALIDITRNSSRAHVRSFRTLFRSHLDERIYCHSDDYRILGFSAKISTSKIHLICVYKKEISCTKAIMFKFF